MPLTLRKTHAARAVDKYYSHPGAGLFTSSQKNCCSVECWTLVQDLRDNPPTPIAALTPPTDTAAREQDLAAPNLDKELPTPTSATPTVFTETIAETPKQPLLLARRATAVPSTPTPATKCPRPEFRRRPRKGQPTKRTPTLSALQEIKCLQMKVDPIIPLLPFLKLVRDIIWELGDFKLRRETVLALREAAEDYLINIFVGANLIVINRGQCTLQAKDLQLCRELRGEEESIGTTEASRIARRRQWREYRAARLTPSETLPRRSTKGGSSANSSSNARRPRPELSSYSYCEFQHVLPVLCLNIVVSIFITPFTVTVSFNCLIMYYHSRHLPCSLRPMLITSWLPEGVVLIVMYF